MKEHRKNCTTSSCKVSNIQIVWWWTHICEYVSGAYWRVRKIRQWMSNGFARREEKFSGKKCVVLMVHDTCQSVHLYFPSFDPQATKEKCVYFKLNACADVHQVDSICSLICWYICQYYHSPHFTPEQLEHVTEMKASVPMCEFTRTFVINTKYEI